MTLKIETCHFSIRDLELRLVGLAHRACPHNQTRLRGRATDVGEHDRQRTQRLAFPVLTDRTKQAVLDWVPLGSACRIVADCYRQVESVGHLYLQLVLPLPRPTTVAPPGIT